MNGQMMNYNKYIQSLKDTPEPTNNFPKLAIDYNGLIEYAKSKGVEPCDLSEDEKNKFIICDKILV